MCDYKPGLPQQGAFYIQGTSSMVSILKILPELERLGLNVKLVYVASTQLFNLQPEDYRARMVTPADRANSTVITTQARWLMHDWLFNKIADEYALSSDWDNRWRTGGNVDEVIDEAHLSPDWVLAGIQKFAGSLDERLGRLQAEIQAVPTELNVYPPRSGTLGLATAYEIPAGTLHRCPLVFSLPILPTRASAG